MAPPRNSKTATAAWRMEFSLVRAGFRTECPFGKVPDVAPSGATERSTRARRSGRMADAFFIRSERKGRMATVSPLRTPSPVTLIEVGWRLVVREHRPLIAQVGAGFPSPAADHVEEPIDLGQWLVEHPAASYVMRVAGPSVSVADIADGDHVVVDRSVAYRSSLANATRPCRFVWSKPAPDRALGLPCRAGRGPAPLKHTFSECSVLQAASGRSRVGEGVSP